MKQHPVIPDAACVGTCLFSRAASSQVFSAQVGLTAVFGMGTGVPPPPSAPTMVTRTRFELVLPA